MYFTPSDLELALVEEVSSWAADMRFRNPEDPRNQNGVPLSVYQGHIPSYAAGPKERAKLQPKAPSVAIKASHFEYERLKGWCEITFLILTWDDNINRLGYKDNLNLMNRIICKLQDDVIIKKSFPILDWPIHGELIEEPGVDFHPWYLALVMARFGVMSYGPGNLGTPAGGQPSNQTGPDTGVYVYNANSDSTVPGGETSEPTQSPPSPLSEGDALAVDESTMFG